MITHPEARGLLDDIFDEIGNEIAEHGDQDDLPDGTGWPYLAERAAIAGRECERATRDGALTWRLVLREQYRKAIAETDPAALRRELVKVAAAATKWIDAIDRRPA